MCQWGANRNIWAGYRMGPSPTPYVPPNAPNRVSNSVSFKFQPTYWWLTKMSIEHILRYIGWLWSNAMNNRTYIGYQSPKRLNADRAVRSPLWWWSCLKSIQTSVRDVEWLKFRISWPLRNIVIRNKKPTYLWGQAKRCPIHFENLCRHSVCQ